MPALPAWARAATRSLLSLPQPSSARMSTATESSCSDNSALSGRPGVPLMSRFRGMWSYAPLHPGGAGGVPTMTRRQETAPAPRAGTLPTSGAGGALHADLQARTVLREPAVAACGLDHL